MLLPPLVAPLLRGLAERFPPVLSQLVYTLLYAITLTLIIRGVVLALAYVDFRYAHATRVRDQSPSDLQRFLGASILSLQAWAPRILIVLALLTGIWCLFAPFRLGLHGHSPHWLVRIVDGWDEGVLRRIGAPMLTRHPARVHEEGR